MSNGIIAVTGRLIANVKLHFCQKENSSSVPLVFYMANHNHCHTTESVYKYTTFWPTCRKKNRQPVVNNEAFRWVEMGIYFPVMKFSCFTIIGMASEGVEFCAWAKICLEIMCDAA